MNSERNLTAKEIAEISRKMFAVSHRIVYNKEWRVLRPLTTDNKEESL